jgi:hypothetical protein
MSGYKESRYANRTSGGYENRLARVGSSAAKANTNTNKGVVGKDVGSWDAYKNWLTKVQAPEQQRSLPDVALFSWKGYRSWAEKVRRDWETND